MGYGPFVTNFLLLLLNIEPGARYRPLKAECHGVRTRAHFFVKPQIRTLNALVWICRVSYPKYRKSPQIRFRNIMS